jgi:3-isopropylmalate/(R)-2-methylmalate dehydratase small subunit
MEPDPKLLESLVCPLTKTVLVYDRVRRELISRAAGLAYPIRDGVPIMLVDEARELSVDESLERYSSTGIWRARSAFRLEWTRVCRYGPRAMEPFTSLSGVAAPLPIVNVDTDMIIPKQFLKTIKRTGLGKALFFELRTHPDGSSNPDFVLNKPAYARAKILIAGANFGCGSSREHAPWALLDFGIRCVIAPSFADIFFNNCFKNGILPIKLPQAQVEKLLDDASRGANATVSIDLEKQEIHGPDGGCITFDVDPFRKLCLLNGWDDIGLTLRQENKISTFETARKTQMPWM